MSTRLPRRALLPGAAALAFLAAAPVRAQAPAPSYEQGGIRISAPWTRAAGRGGTGAGFATLRNTGDAPDRLVAARSAIAGTVELHSHIRDGDVMRMRPVPGIDLPPGQEVRLGPGGLHIMLIGLREPLNQGSRVPLTLVFERAGTIEVELAVQSAGARGPGGHAH